MVTEIELFRAIRALYPPAEYAVLPQVANGTGARANRHADAMCLSLWPSRGIHLSGFEIKCYRGDWVRELRNPEKADSIAQFCNFWWIVASGPFIKSEEIPELWGLMTWDAEKKVLVKTKAAQYRKATAPDISFIAGMLRKAQECVGPDAELAQAKAEAFAKGEEQGKKSAGWEVKELADLQKRVREFEKASGVKIKGRWENGTKIGEAVNAVLNGTVAHDRDQLRKLVVRIIKDLGPEAIGDEQ